MQVHELIKLLQKEDRNMPVYVPMGGELADIKRVALYGEYDEAGDTLMPFIVLERESIEGLAEVKE